MKKIIPALAMLLISAIVMSTASFAWFSMSATATAQGMEINAIAGGALLIDSTNSGFVGKTVHDFADNAANNKTAKNLDACSYDATNGYVYVDNANKQYVNANTGVLDTSEGKGKTTPVSASDAGKYYVDYLVYLASDKSYNTKALTATVTFTGIDANENDTLKAATVDFYYATMAAEVDATHDEVKLTNAADGTAWTKVATNVSGYMTGNALTVTIANNLQIPAKDGVEIDKAAGEINGAVAVLMRVYFDGDLPIEGSTGQYYVRSNAIATDNVGVSVVFGAPQ